MLFLYGIACYILKIFLYLSIFVAVFIVLCRLFFEPTKGVCRCKRQLHGKVALVTGGNAGIGLETVKDLARRGARVIIACRNAEKSKDVIEDIARTTGNTNVEYRYLDLSKSSCIRQFADDFNRSFDRLDILVNNAGVAGLKPKVTESGVEITMQINYVGPFLLTHLLMDKIIASKPSRIVIVSSKLHYFGKLNIKDLAGVNTSQYMIRYANSKLCNVLWAKALAKRLPKGVTVNSLHPGVVKTEIFQSLPPFWRSFTYFVIDVLFKTPKEGAQTTIHLCVAPELEHSTGGYYSDCKLRPYYRQAQNEELAKAVWSETLALINEKC